MKTERIEARFIEKGLEILEEVTKTITLKDKLICKDILGYRYRISYEGIRGETSPLPFSMFNEFTIENIKLFIKNNKQGFELISKEYVNSKDYNLTVKCPKGHEFLTSWQVLQRPETQCVKCNQPNKGLTIMEFKELLYDEYELVGEYVNVSTDVVLRHECGYEYKIQPSRFIIKKPSCAKCKGLTKKTTKEFVQEIKDIYGSEYIILGEYEHSHIPTLIQHSCGYQYQVTPTNLLSGKKCPECAGMVTLSHNEFAELVNGIGNGEYIVLGEYINCKTKISMKHIECG